MIVLLSFSHVIYTSMSLLNCPSITDSNGHTSFVIIIILHTVHHRYISVRHKIFMDRITQFRSYRLRFNGLEHYCEHIIMLASVLHKTTVEQSQA